MLRGSTAPSAGTACRVALTLLAGSFLASCSTSSDPLTRLGVSPQQLALNNSVAPQPQAGPAQSAAATDPVMKAAAPAGYMILGENDKPLPEQVTAVPTLRDGGVQITATDPARPAPGTAGRLGENAGQQQLAAAAPHPAGVPAGQHAVAQAGKTQADINAIAQSRIESATPAGATATAVTTTAQAAPAPQPEAKKRGFFASIFGAPEQQNTAPAAATAFAATPAVVPALPTAQPSSAQIAVQPATAAQAPAASQQQLAAAATSQPKATAFIENIPAGQQQNLLSQGPKASMAAGLFGSSARAAGPAPLIRPNSVAAPVTLASVTPQDGLGAAERRQLYSNDALPGVRASELYEIKRKSGTNDDSDVDIYEDEGPVEVASAAGLARLAPNGLLKQTDRVDVACMKPTLVRVLKSIEDHYGRKVIVTSGYRSPPVNIRARGARNSLHMYCAAADIQVEGVGKWELAEFVRTMPGRGGVGTYCHTNSVHVDVGPERDWNWRCRRGKRRA